MTDTGRTAPTQAIAALLFGNLVIGTGVLLPVGLLDRLAADLSVSPARAGLLVLVGGLVVGFGAPVLASLTAGIDRRRLLALTLVLYAAGHFLSAMWPSFLPLVVLRALTMAGAAIFTPQAASAVSLIVPAERRAGAIALIFIGWSLASVLGIPAGSLIGAALGWQAAYLAMAALSAAGAVLVWVSLPDGLRVARLSAAVWLSVLTNPLLLAVLAVTLLSMSGQFTLFSYVAPVLGSAFAADAGDVALTFGLVGLAGVAGNFAAARVVSRLGIEPTIFVSLLAVGAGLVLVALGWGSLGLFITGGCLWGLGGFAANSLQQSRLVALAPALAAGTVALNTSVVYLGQALGSWAGGLVMVRGGPSPLLAWIGAGFVAAAAVASVLAAAAARRRAAAPG